MSASLGPSWMDPSWLLSRLGPQMITVSAAIVFVECGLLFPFLPGDSLLFSIGLFIRRADLGQAGLSISLPQAIALLTMVAFAGNVAGHEIGRLVGPAVYRHDGRWLRREHLDRTHSFFLRHGRSALVLGRFIPVIRTFVTLVSGVSRMPRRTFYAWSLIGAFAWVTAVTTLGYLLGSITFLQHNIDVVLAVIIALSLVPAAVEWWRHRRTGAPEAHASTGEPVPGRQP